MRKTAIILAGAAMFDLGVVAVSVQAQESLRPSPGTVGTARGTTSNPESSGPAGQTRAVDMFLKIDRVNSVQACTARRGEVVRHEGVQQCRIPADGSGSADAAPRSRIMSELSSMEAEIFIKIDVVDTVQACAARRGEVVMHEGVQQCRVRERAAPGGDQPSPRRR